MIRVADYAPQQSAKFDACVVACVAEPWHGLGDGLRYFSTLPNKKAQHRANGLGCERT